MYWFIPSFSKPEEVFYVLDLSYLYLIDALEANNNILVVPGVIAGHTPQFGEHKAWFVYAL